jgi:cation:H+ antiporter
MPTPLLVLIFVTVVGAALAASAVLVVRIERIGVRLGVTESVLGLAAAVAADAPEITSAITALVRGQHDVGVGVVLGANVFQLAALLGLGALAADGIRLERLLVAFEGVSALWLALLAAAVVAADFPPAPALGLALVVFVPYVVVSALSPSSRERLPVRRRWKRALNEVLVHEEQEISEVIEPLPRGRRDGAQAAVSVAVVIAASVALEATAVELGKRWNIPDLLLGAVVLAALTSLPNLVAAIYLARRGRGAATLSEALNSNRVNTLAGLLVPAVFLGAGFSAALGPGAADLAVWYVVMTAAVLVLAHIGRGLRHAAGVAILVAYALIVVSLLR